MWRLTAGCVRGSASAARGEPPERTKGGDERRWAGSRSTPPSSRAATRCASDRSRIGIDRGQVRLIEGARTGTVHGMPDRLLLPVFILLWSSGYVVGALAIEVADPLPLLGLRFALASLVAVPLALRHGRWRGAPLGRLAVVGLLLQVVQFGGVYGGFALGVPAGLGALIMLGLSPLVTSGLAIAGGQERGDARLWIGLAIGVAGVAISLAPAL